MRAFPLWESLLPEGHGHDCDLSYPPACSYLEAPPPLGVGYFRSCPACMIAQHAEAMNDPDGMVMTEVAGLVTAREAMNRSILDFHLPFPLVP